jgi:hypothetical protein
MFHVNPMLMPNPWGNADELIRRQVFAARSSSLFASGVIAGQYGDATHIGQFTVDAQGRLVQATAVAITFPAIPAADDASQVLSKAAFLPRNPLVPIGVTPGQYGDGTHVAQVTVDALGRVISVTPVSITASGTANDDAGNVISKEVFLPRNLLVPNGVTPGQNGDATHTLQVTVDSNGRITAIAPVAIAAAGANLTADAQIFSEVFAPRNLLVPNGVTPGQNGDATHTLQVTVDSNGRITSIAPVAIAAAGANLTADAQIFSEVFSPRNTLVPNGVTPGQYGDATHVPQITVDAQGRVSKVAAVAVSSPSTAGIPCGFRSASASATTITVGPGYTLDAATPLIKLTSKQTLTLTLAGGSTGGNDTKTMTGTVSINNGSTTATGSSTLFATEFGTRNGTGSLTTTSSSTAVVGSGTLFMSELTIGDLVYVNDGAALFRQVVAIADDTHLTLGTAVNTGASGIVFTIVENPVFAPGPGGSPQVVSVIASNTSLTLASAYTGSNETSVTPLCGGRQTGITNEWVRYYVWVGSGGSGTAVFFSTQRTTPFGISGYNTYVRRVGYVVTDANGIFGFSQSGGGLDRAYKFECNLITVHNAALGIFSGAAATGSWTDVTAQQKLLSPSVQSITLLGGFEPGSGQGNWYFRKRGAGETDLLRPDAIVGEASLTYLYQQIEVNVDDAQAFQQVAGSSGTGTAYLVGCKESLLK